MVFLYILGFWDIFKKIFAQNMCNFSAFSVTIYKYVLVKPINAFKISFETVFCSFKICKFNALHN